MMQRECKDLIRTARRIVAVLAVDDVEEVLTGLEPESVLKLSNARRQRFELAALLGITVPCAASPPAGAGRYAQAR